MPLSVMQRAYIANASHRWNVKTGAVRSGKTYGDYFIIPQRIRDPERMKSGGIVLLIGATYATLCRNILDPMRKLWGDSIVGKPSSDGGSVTMFGEKCVLLGGMVSGQASKLQGTSVKYCYGDEITTWSPELFDMLKSRLDRPCSMFDGTCNPAGPEHWFKKFLDSDADIYTQSYTIDDNPYLAPAFVAALKEEYKGSVWYDRYILGKWTVAEGAVYKRFADAPEHYILPDGYECGALTRIYVGVDFGGNRSATAFVAVAEESGTERNRLIVLSSERRPEAADSAMLCESFCEFCCGLRRYDTSVTAYCDNAEPVLIRTLKDAARTSCPEVNVRPALKSPVNDRIRLTTRLLSNGGLLLSSGAATVADAMKNARWSDAISNGRDIRLDNGSSDIDTLDALEYALERF